jgi:zinc/manganese transport system substrate-binding protein
VRALLLLGLVLSAGSVPLTGCGATYGSASSPGKLRVVAAESVWGSIAAQIGGDRVAVTSVIADPGTDPHEYEPRVSDAVALAGARLAIVNGTGYDPWAAQLLAADGGSERSVLDVGRLLGLSRDANPHQWYDPAGVARVSAGLAADLAHLDPSDAALFRRRAAAFERVGLASYRRLIAGIRARYRGVPVGYSESIFAPLGRALGLRLMTPASFARAIAEGTEVSAADRATVDGQARRRQIAVWIDNRQNATPDVEHVNRLAAAAGIPVVAITETLSPRTATFEAWQVSQLRALRQALARARPR